MQRQLNITIDIDSRKVTKYNDLIKVGDTVNLQLTLLTKGKKIEVTQETVQLFFKKEDNKKVQQFVMTSDNIIECTLDAQVTTKVGKVIGEVLFTASNVQVTSSSFIFNVEGSVNNEVLEESTDKIKTFDDINTTIKDVNETVEKYKNNIETIAGTSESVAALVEIKKCIEDSNKNLNDTILEGNILKDDIDTANIQAIKNIDTIGNVTKLIKDIDDLKQKEIELEGDITGTTTFNGTGTIKIETKVKDLTEDDIPNIKASKIMDIGTAATKNIGNKKDNIPILNEEGKLDEVILPESIMQKVNTLENKVLKNELTPIETDSVLTKLPNCIGEYVHNMQIKGRTLQNICKTKGGTIKPNGSLALGLTYMFKQNTIYTLIVNSKANSLDGTIKIVLETPNIYPGVIVNKGEIGLKTFKFQTPNIQTGMSIYTDSSTIGECILDDIMILEGDWTNKEIPSYFEGIKSVGEVEGNKISILSKGKNLFDINCDYIYRGINFVTQDNVIKINGTATEYAYIDIPYRNIKKEKEYVVSIINIKDGISLTGGINLRDVNKDFLVDLTTPKFILNSDVGYCRLYVQKGQTVYIEIKVQIEEGKKATEYIEPKEDKTEILLPSPHMELPNGVADVIYFDRNTRTRNVEVTTLDTLDPSFWNVTATDITTPNTIEFQHNLATASSDSYILTDRFNFYEADWLWSKDIEGIGINNKNNNLQLRINKSRLETPNSAGLNKWLKENKPLLIYQLATPVIEKLNIKDTLQTFTDGYIMLDNAITPTAQLEYSTNIPSAIGGLTKVVDHNVDEITNIESTISDMDAEIGEARKDKNTLNERLEDDKKEIDLQLKEKANLKDVKIFSSLSDIGLSANDMTTDFSNNVLKIIKNMGANRRISLYPYQTESNTNLYNSVKAWCGFNTDAYQLYIDTSFNGAENLPNKIKVIPNYNDGNNKIFIGFFDNQLGNCREVATTESFEIKLLNGASVYLTDSNYSPYFIRVGQLATITGNIKVSGISDDTVIMRLLKPKGHKWIRAFTNNGKPISFYLSPSGELKIRGASGVDEGDNLPLDFSYRI